jgi:hypothetical protein
LKQVSRQRYVNALEARIQIEIIQRSWETLSGGALEAAWAISEEQGPPKVPVKRRRGRGRLQ